MNRLIILYMIAIVYAIFTSCTKLNHNISNENNNENNMLEYSDSLILDNEAVNIYNLQEEYFIALDNYEPTNYKITEKDLEVGLKLEYKGLISKGFKDVSENIFYKRLQLIFGIEKDKLSQFCYIKNEENFLVYLVDYTGKEEYMLSDFSTEHDDLYISKQYRFVTSLPIMLGIVRKSDDGFLRIDIGDSSFHENNYIFHNSQSSLTWLINNDMYFIEQLLIEFGYDREPKINKKVLDIKYQEYIKTEPYNVRALDNLFVKKEYDGNIHIREGLMKYIADSTTIESPELLNMLCNYGRYILQKDTALTKDQKIKVAAYIGYYDQLVRRKYEIDDTIPPHVVPLGWDYGDFLRNETNQDNNLLEEIKDNNYYNLEGYQEMIDLVYEKIEEEQAMYDRTH